MARVARCRRRNSAKPRPKRSRTRSTSWVPRKRRDILLIADEVICCCGRTGHWFASEYYGIEADFMTLAKGITSGYVPLSAAMIGDRVADVLIASGEVE